MEDTEDHARRGKAPYASFLYSRPGFNVSSLFWWSRFEFSSCSGKGSITKERDRVNDSFFCNPSRGYTQATTLAQTLNVELLTIPHDELAIPQYAENPINRCYFCKDSFYEICRREAARLSLRTIADGVNLDDLQDYRPGIQAAKEYQILHPLVEAGFTKAEVRQASRFLGLPTWEKPASPCLSSRVPYGTHITATMLSQIAQAEALIRSLGFRDLRVRHHETSARIELIPEDLQGVSSPSVIFSFEGRIKAQRFTTVLLDLEGYKSGVFNEGIRK